MPDWRACARAPPSPRTRPIGRLLVAVDYVRLRTRKDDDEAAAAAAVAAAHRASASAASAESARAAAADAAARGGAMMVDDDDVLDDYDDDDDDDDESDDEEDGEGGDGDDDGGDGGGFAELDYDSFADDGTPRGARGAAARRRRRQQRRDDAAAVAEAKHVGVAAAIDGLELRRPKLEVNKTIQANSKIELETNPNQTAFGQYPSSPN